MNTIAKTLATLAASVVSGVAIYYTQSQHVTGWYVLALIIIWKSEMIKDDQPFWK